MPLFTVCIDRPCESQDGCQANSYLYIKQSVSSHRRVIFLSCFAPGGFITLCLLQMNNFTFSFGKKLGKKKKRERLVCGGILWPAFLECLCLEVMYRSVWDLLIARGCRLLPEAFPRLVGRWGSGPRGVFFIYFFWPCHLAENVVWQATKPTVTKQGIDWIISVSSDRPPAASNTAGINGCQSCREEIGNLFVSEFHVLHLMFCSTL